MISEQKRYAIRRVKLFFNRLKSNYHLRNEGKLFKIVIPVHRKRIILSLKYFFSVLGLLSVFIIFNSIWIAFVFACAVYFLTFLLEKIAFSHNYAFIHPMPDFEIDPDKWVGVGFGYATTLSNKADIPLLSMVTTDLECAKKFERLFLEWTKGKYIDEEKNVQISIVVINPKEYIFLCYPNPKRPIAKRFFQSARDKLHNSSLEDEVAEHHIMLVLGKRCKIEQGSYFPEFRRRYKEGVPIEFEFVLPPFDKPRSTTEIPPFIFFDFSIKDKSALTRKDFTFDAIWSFERGGRWQGPNKNINTPPTMH